MTQAQIQSSPTAMKIMAQAHSIGAAVPPHILEEAARRDLEAGDGEA